MSGPKSNYFKIRNELWEALMVDFKIPTMERRVLGWVIRHSYGMRASDRCRMDREAVAARLKTSPKKISEAVSGLVKNKALICFKKGRPGKPSIYGPQPRFERWKYERTSTNVIPQNGGGVIPQNGGGVIPQNGGGVIPQIGVFTPPENGITTPFAPTLKDSIKRQLKKTTTKENACGGLFSFFKSGAERTLTFEELTQADEARIREYMADYSEDIREAYTAFGHACGQVAKSQAKKASKGDELIFLPVAMAISKARQILKQTKGQQNQ